MTRLTATHPELFSNETLGDANKSPYLDQVALQAKEDFNARQEGREPRTVIAEDRDNKFKPSGSVPSDIQPKLSFKEDANSEDDEFDNEFNFGDDE